MTDDLDRPRYLVRLSRPKSGYGEGEESIRLASFTLLKHARDNMIRIAAEVPKLWEVNIIEEYPQYFRGNVTYRPVHNVIDYRQGELPAVVEEYS